MTSVAWVRSGQWFETSGCGKYTVAASKVDGKFVFQAWRGKELLHTDTDAQVCRDRCAKHARGPEVEFAAIGQTGVER